MGAETQLEYDVDQMKESLEKAISRAKAEVKEKFSVALRTIYKDCKVPDVPDSVTFGNVKISKHVIKSPSDLKGVTSGPGFYIIMTNHPVSGNNACRLTANGGLRAIYRGECGAARKRIQSHLFNTQYSSEYDQRRSTYMNNDKNKGKAFYEPFWPACLKIKEGVNGINIDTDNEYNRSVWMVIVHDMKGSSQEVREQAELAFDDVFGKPIACREKR